MNSPATTTKLFGGQSMTSALRRVLVCPPRRAGWADHARSDKWRDLHYLREPELAAAQSQHEAMQRALRDAGAEVLPMPESHYFSLDAVYCHDASLVTDYGAVILRMGKAARAAEPQRHAEFYKSKNIPILGEIQSPGVVESGDIVWLDAATLLVGRGLRTNAAGIDQLRLLFEPYRVDVIATPLPYGAGPAGCMHLMSLLSLLDPHTVLVDLPLMACDTVDLLRDRELRFVEIDPAERETLACNVLSLGDKRLLALEENARTNARLRDAGFDVRTFPGRAIAINGGGGPTCLTRPILRG